MKQNNQKNIHTMDCFAPLHSARNDDKKPYIIVNLNKNGERFLPNIAKDIQPYINKGYTIYFVPIAKGHNTYYNDLQYKTQLEQYVIASEVIDETRQSKNLIQLLDREDDFANFVQILKKAEVVIGTRLHLFLIASFLHVPTKVYPYQRKILKMQEVIKELSHNKQKN
jgi:polysaccharide pyruvyl transferase WcaK-like protein